MLTEIFKNIFIEGLYNLEGTQRVVADIIAIMLFFLFWACATCGYKLFKLLEAVTVALLAILIGGLFNWNVMVCILLGILLGVPVYVFYEKVLTVIIFLETGLITLVISGLFLFRDSDVMPVVTALLAASLAAFLVYKFTKPFIIIFTSIQFGFLCGTMVDYVLNAPFEGFEFLAQILFTAWAIYIQYKKYGFFKEKSLSDFSWRDSLSKMQEMNADPERNNLKRISPAPVSEAVPVQDTAPIPEAAKVQDTAPVSEAAKVSNTNIKLRKIPKEVIYILLAAIALFIIILLNIALIGKLSKGTEEKEKKEAELYIPDSEEELVVSKTDDKKKKVYSKVKVIDENQDESDSSIVPKNNLTDYIIGHYFGMEVTPYLLRMGDTSICIISYMKDSDWDSAGIDIITVKGDEFSKVYSGNEPYYYAKYTNEGINILYETRPDYSLSPQEAELSKDYRVITFDDGMISKDSIDADTYYQRLKGAVWINGRYHLISPELICEEEIDYSYDVISKLVDYAEENDELILDSAYIRTGDRRNIYATLRNVRADYKMPYYDYPVFESFEVACLDDKGIKILDRENLIQDDELYYDINSFGCFEFDDCRHYYVEVAGIDDYYVKYVYGDNGKKASLLLSDKNIFQTDNGTFCSMWAESGIVNAEITFEDGKYRQYSSENISEEAMSEKFENFNQIIDSNLEDLYNQKEIYIEGLDVCEISDIYDVQLLDIQKGSNDKYYLTYDYKFRAGYSEDVQSDYELNFFYTYKVEDDLLVREEGLEFNNMGRKSSCVLDLPFA